MIYYHNIVIMRFQLNFNQILKSVNDVTIFESYVTIVFVTDFNFVTPEISSDNIYGIIY
jgi:hypothetical protein